jgi:MFS family permease
MKGETTGAGRWRALGAIIASISVMGVTYALTMPLISLRLEEKGVDPTLIGLNASMMAFGMMMVPPLIPALLRRLGVINYLLISLGGTGVTLALFAIVDWVPAWFALRFMLSTFLSGLFVVSEAWINHLAGPTARGRIMGFYSSALAAGFTMGPLVLQATGIHGTAPFLAGICILVLAALPLLVSRGDEPPLAGHPSRGVLGFAGAAPIATAAALAFGAIEAGVLSLLPIYGVRSGLAPETAAAMAAALGAGNVAMQVPIGWLADRTDVRWALVLCATAGLGAAVSLPFTVGTVYLWPALFLAGGVMMGIYTLGLTLLGQRFSGPDLAAANGAFVVFYGIGALGGPTITGLAMDTIPPHGLPLMLGTFCLAFGALATMRTLRGQS